MDLRKYLQEQSDVVSRGAEHVRQFKVFDFNYIPEHPFVRDESKPVIDACLRYWATGIPNHLFLFGSRGCGKTLLVRSTATLLRELHGMPVHYVNCRHHNTSFKILAALLGVRPRGNGLDELFARFCQQHHGKAILVLDEVDLISDKDRRREILYLVSRADAAHMVVLLSNHPGFLSTIDESTRSTLQPQIIHFRNYNAQEIAAILEVRARAGLHHPEDFAGTITQISSLVTKTGNADVRLAIKTLYHVAIESGLDVSAALGRAQRDVLQEQLRGLSSQNMIILKVIADTPEKLARNIYAHYRALCQQHREPPFSYMHFTSALSYLQSVGLIPLSIAKVGRTYTHRIEPLFPVSTFEAVWQYALA